MAVGSSTRARTAVILALMLLGTVLASSNGNQPQSFTPPTISILSPFEILEPSTGQESNSNQKGDDKDGFPPQSGSADPEEIFLQIRLVVTDALLDPSVTLTDNNVIRDDFTIDGDNGRDLDLLDGIDDNKLGTGTYNIYFNLNKTGYAPKDTAPGTQYVAPFVSSASNGVNGAIENYQATISFTGGPPVSSAMFAVKNANSASINQHDLDWLDTVPSSVSFEVGQSFEVRTKYKQSSAESMKHFMMQAYYIGTIFRMTHIAALYYNNMNPGALDISSPPPPPTQTFSDDQYLDQSQLPSTLDNNDYWITRYFFTKIADGPSPIRPYVQTRGGGNAWKTDSGYVAFFGIVNPAILNITKTFSSTPVISGPNPPVVGQTTTYELLITVKNTGEDNALGVVVTDAIPAGATWTGVYTASLGTVAFSSGTVMWTVGTLAPGQYGTLKFRVSVTPTDADLGKKLPLNTGASALGTSQDSGAAISAGPTPFLETAPVTGALSVTLDKVVDHATATPGDHLTYTITVKNTGDLVAHAVVLTDTIPSLTSFVSAVPAPDGGGGPATYTWTLGDIAAGVTKVVTITVAVGTGVSDAATLVNNAALDYKNAAGIAQGTLYDSASTTVKAPVMDIVKTAGGITEADPGDTIVYTLTYTNSGTGDASGVVVVDTLPADVDFVSAVPAPTGGGPTVYTWSIGSVPAGTTAAITVTVKVKISTPDETELLNGVTLDYKDLNGNAKPQKSDDYLITVTRPIMDISKSVDASSADPGDLLTYTITYENTGTGVATAVTIVDTIDPETSFYSATPAPTSYLGDVFTWVFPSVAPGFLGTITLKVKVDVGTADDTLLTNSVTLAYKDANGNAQPGDSDSADTTVTAPIMSIAKTASQSTADPGDTFTYTLTYKNMGDGVATDVKIVDTLPEQLEYVSASPSPDSVSGQVLTWNFAFVAGNSEASITITVKVLAGTPDDVVMTNTATLDSEDANGNPLDQESDSVNVEVTAPIMSITKTADAAFYDPGDTITYTITYKNDGDGEATGVVIKDTLPVGVTYVSSVPAPTSIAGLLLTWSIGTMAANSVAVITVTVTVNTTVADDTLLLNSVTMDSKDANGNDLPQKSSSVSVEVTAPSMTVDKAADVGTADPGDVILYTITYTNGGDGIATDVVIQDTLPAAVSFLNSNPVPSGTSGQIVWFNFTTIAANSGGTIFINVTVNAFTPDGTLLTNSVLLNYEDANGNPKAPKSDSVDVTVTAPIMTFEKSVDVLFADPGDTVVYTLKYKNTGTGMATNVKVVDVLPALVVYVSSAPAYTTKVGQTLSWTVGSVGAGVSGTITVTVKVAVGTADDTLLVNSASLNYDDANGNSQTTLFGSATTEVTAPILTLVKTASVSTADPGDTIVYTLDFDNIGDGDATGVTLVDTLPARVNFVSADAPCTHLTGVVTCAVGFMAGNSGGLLTITVTVKVGTVDKTLLHNTVTGDYADANGNALPQKTSFADVTVTAPTMFFDKHDNETFGDTGDIFNYTLLYKNTGTGVASNVTIVDTLPATIDILLETPPPTSTSGLVHTWVIGTLAPGAEGKITIMSRVKPGTPDKTVVFNTATLSFRDANGNPLTPITDTASLIVRAPVMTVTKVANVDFADPSDTIVYTIHYENTGTGRARGVTLKDTLPAQVDFVSATSPCVHSAGVVTCVIGSVLAGVGGNVTITVKVKVGTPDETLLHNTVTLDYTDRNFNPLPQKSAFDDVTVTAPQLSFSKVANVTLADPSDLILYTLKYKNTGSGVATSVTVVDTIPAATTYVSSTPGYSSVVGDIYTWLVGTVGVGVEGYINVTVRVDAYTADGVVLHNTATLDYKDANGNAYLQLNGSADTTVTAPVMDITKTADVSEADPGDVVTYTLFYQNTGTGEATDVVIADMLPAEVAFDASVPVPDGVSGQLLTWTFASLSGLSNGTITIYVTVLTGTADETGLHNAVQLDYDDANGNAQTPETSFADVTVTAPVFTFSKSVDASTADPGDLLVYVLSYQNIGTGDASLVIVEDTLPADVTFISSVPAATSAFGQTHTWVIGDVAAGASGTITITVRVNAYTADGTLLTNTATVEYADDNGNFIEAIEKQAATTVTAPDMTILKTASVTEADPGDTIVYTIKYTNSGSGEATNVLIVDTLPADVSFVGSTPDPFDVTGQVLTWLIPSVAGNSDGTITITVEVLAGTDDGTQLKNEVTLNYDDANSNDQAEESDDASSFVTAPVGDFTKTAPVANADPGDSFTYTLTFTNTGAGNATDVYINDTLPSDVEYVSSTPDPTSSSGSTYSWLFPLVGPGGTAVVTLTVKVKVTAGDGTTLINAATTDYHDDNGNLVETLLDNANVVVTRPILSIVKDAAAPEANPSDTVTYTLTIHNGGTGNATAVHVEDNLPDPVTYVDADPDPTSIVGGDLLIWDLGPLASNGTIVITVTVTVDAFTADETLLHNTASVDYKDANGNAQATEEDYADVAVTAPILEMTKEASAATADPSDPVTYTISYANIGTGDADNVVITDALPAEVTFVSADAPCGEAAGVVTCALGLVAAGTGGSKTILVTVDAYTPDTTVLDNDASLNFTDVNGNAYAGLTDSADVDVTAPIMDITKTADVLSADSSDTISYTLHYENTGTGVATGVVIIDTLPAGVVYAGAVPPPDSAVSGVLTWLIGAVGPGASVYIEVDVTVVIGLADATVLQNSVSLDYNDANGNPQTQETAFVNVLVTAPVIDVSKDASQPTADPSDEYTYTISYSNTGSGDATGVVIVDTLPPELTYVGSSVAPTSIVGATLTWEIGFVGSGDSGSIVVTVDVLAYTPDMTLIANEVNLDYSDANGNFIETVEDVTFVTVTAPDMNVFKDGGVTTADPGDLLTYTLSYENLGTGDATDVIIVDTLPDTVTFSGCTPACVVDGAIVTFTIPLVPAGTSGAVYVSVFVNGLTPDGTLILNDVFLDYDDNNTNPFPEEDDTASVTVTAPIMSFAKEGTASASPGETILYVLTYFNSGTGLATGVVIEDTLPAGLTFVSSIPAPDLMGPPTYTWIISDVLPGTGGSILYFAKVGFPMADGTVLKNTAVMDHDDANGGPYPPIEDDADAPIVSGSIGDRVWKDSDLDGIQDGGEVGVDGVTVTLTGTTAFGDPVLMFTTTAGGGLYLFSGLAPGNYTATVTVPALWFATTPTAVSHSLASGEDFLAADFGIVNAIIMDITLRCAGEKWHDVIMYVYDDGLFVGSAEIYREPGDPKDQQATIYGAAITPSGTFNATVYYTPEDDPINGQNWGDNPCWIILDLDDGTTIKIKHNFNVKHPGTYVWQVEMTDEITGINTPDIQGIDDTVILTPVPTPRTPSSPPTPSPGPSMEFDEPVMKADPAFYLAATGTSTVVRPAGRVTATAAPESSGTTPVIILSDSPSEASPASQALPTLPVAIPAGTTTAPDSAPTLPATVPSAPVKGHCMSGLTLLILLLVLLALGMARIVSSRRKTE